MGDAQSRFEGSQTLLAASMSAARSDGGASESTSNGLRDGSQTGRFRIDGVLGRGAMGIVYRAYDPQLGRSLALKVPRADHGDDVPVRAGPDPFGETPTIRARFLQEARGLAQLSHPNVVQVFSVEHFDVVPGLVDGACAIAMEIVEGTTLDSWLRRSRSTEETLAVFAAAGRGLAAAHRAGLVHRDFKPANVVVGNDGRVRVMDFGLVTHSDSRPSRPDAVELTQDGHGDATLTRSGTTVGTPAYMAPEQHLGHGADPRSDQFAFCVALFEALFGFRPFQGASCNELSRNKQLGRRRSEPANHRVAPRVVAAIRRGLEPQSQRRFASMDELLAALIPTRRPRRPVLRTLVAGAMLAGLGLGCGMLMPETDDVGAARPVAEASLAPVLRRRLGHHRDR